MSYDLDQANSDNQYLQAPNFLGELDILKFVLCDYAQKMNKCKTMTVDRLELQSIGQQNLDIIWSKILGFLGTDKYPRLVGISF